MDLSFTLSVIFTGIVIVFIVLIALILLMFLLGKLAGDKNSASTETKAEAQKIVSPPAAAPRIAAKPATDGVTEETVAVIAAAVAAFTDGRGKVVSVQNAQNNSAQRGDSARRSAWSMAGLHENTQPF